MKKVTLEDFKEEVIHKGVKEIVFRGDKEGTGFDLGFSPESEFVYHFDITPDVFFQNLSIKEVYYEPYRTFIRLEHPLGIKIYYPGTSNKIHIKGI